jgi:hypothetical protein
MASGQENWQYPNLVGRVALRPAAPRSARRATLKSGRYRRIFVKLRPLQKPLERRHLAGELAETPRNSPAGSQRSQYHGHFAEVSNYSLCPRLNSKSFQVGSSAFTRLGPPEGGTPNPFLLMRFPASEFHRYKLAPMRRLAAMVSA